MTGDDATATGNAKGVKGIAVVCDVDKIKRARTQQKEEWKQQQLINVGKIFACKRVKAIHTRGKCGRSRENYLPISPINTP